ncbi:MAG: helix-turn-helix domain-containing protein [Candidatus Thiodiazotropha taylori]|nr:helix-turn-helix domain-containing protein [Candidatus Thiodiazotropha taylori]
MNPPITILFFYVLLIPMSNKHTSPSQKSKIISLRLAGYSYSTIADQVGVSTSTVKRHTKNIKKGAVKQEMVDQAKEELLSNLNDDTVKTQLSALIADDISLTQRVRSNILTTLEKIERQTPSDAREAALIMRSLNAAATAIKSTGDALRQSLGVSQREIHSSSGGELPVLTIVDMTQSEINQVKQDAEARALGHDDGLGGVLASESEDDNVVEGRDEPEAA